MEGTSRAESRGGWLMKPFVWLRRLYDWVLGFARTPQGPLALFLVAVAESSFFPIPPDVLLIALAVALPTRALWFAGITTLGSVVGAFFGYVIGVYFYELVGRRIIEFYSAEDRYEQVRLLYDEWDAIAVGIAGFTPIPFKVFTIAAGTFEINLATFLVASLVGRGARFFLVGFLILRFGPRIKRWIDRYFNILTVVFVALLIGGFILVRYAI